MTETKPVSDPKHRLVSPRRIASRLLAALAVVAAAMVVLGFVAILSFIDLADRVDGIAEISLPAVIEMGKLGQQSESIVAQAPRVAAAQSTTALETLKLRIADRRLWLEEIVQSLGGNNRLGVDEPRVLAALAEMSLSLDDLERLAAERIRFGERRAATASRIMAVATRVRERQRRGNDAGARDEAVAASEAVTMLLAAAMADDDLLLLQYAERFAALQSKRMSGPGAWDLSLQLELAVLGQPETGIFAIRSRELDIERQIAATLDRSALASDRLVAAVAEASMAVEQDTLRRSQDLQDELHWRSHLIVGVVAGGLVAMVLAMLYFRRSVGLPLQALHRCMTDRAQGLSTPIPAIGDPGTGPGTGGDDEIAAMTRALSIFLGMIEDKTRTLRAREDELRSILDSSLVPILVVRTEDHSVLFFNTASGRALGLGQSAPRRFDSFLPQGAPLPGIALRQGEALTEEIQLERADGTAFLARLTVVPITFQDLNARLISFTDVTAQREYERRLREAKQSAEEAMRVKSDFLAMMSHEVRTPLNGILGMAELLRGTQLSPEQADYAETIGQSGASLLTVLNDVLDLSKMEAGQLVVEKVPFNTRELVATIATLMMQRAREKGLGITVAIDDAVPDVLVGDPSRIRQILLNFLSNAVKFTETGGVTIAVSVNAGRARTVNLRFMVRDTGIGIDPAFKAKLFNPFTQADPSISRRYGGTGLGLAICRRLIEAMGGAIGVEDGPDGGSDFWFSLDLEDPPANLAAPAVRAKTPAALSKTPAAGAPRRLKVLLVEDTDVNRRVAEGLIGKLGHDVHSVGDGDAALAEVESLGTRQGDAYDLILMDMRMPGRDGLDTTREMRRRGIAIPIVALTANVAPKDVRLCLEAGMDGHLAKPFSLPDLAKILAGIADRE